MNNLKRARLLLMICVAMVMVAQPRDRERYVISVGTPANAIASGTIWLYRYSWYGLQKLELAPIKGGVALVPTDVEHLKRKFEPNSSIDAYVLVIQAGEHVWYRTPNIPQTRSRATCSSP